ncbi:hypothetical protein BJV78DRAFT_1151733 [Lactifluus subvellereus]|nr:hypothetical protein BJV78DRAFT_1151733 [Lactifluus subvellereus]
MSVMPVGSLETDHSEVDLHDPFSRLAIQQRKLFWEEHEKTNYWTQGGTQLEAIRGRSALKGLCDLCLAVLVMCPLFSHFHAMTVPRGISLSAVAAPAPAPARGSGRLCNQGSHLKLHSGFTGASSTLLVVYFPISKDYGRDLARTFYEAVFYEQKARELRDAVKKLRRKRDVTFERWVNFGHYLPQCGPICLGTAVAGAAFDRHTIRAASDMRTTGNRTGSAQAERARLSCYGLSGPGRRYKTSPSSGGMLDEGTIRVEERLELVEVKFVDGPCWQSGAKTEALRKGLGEARGQGPLENRDAQVFVCNPLVTPHTIGVTEAAYASSVIAEGKDPVPTAVLERDNGNYGKLTAVPFKYLPQCSLTLQVSAGCNQEWLLSPLHFQQPMVGGRCLDLMCRFFSDWREKLLPQPATGQNRGSYVSGFAPMASTGTFMPRYVGSGGVPQGSPSTEVISGNSWDGTVQKLGAISPRTPECSADQLSDNTVSPGAETMGNGGNSEAVSVTASIGGRMTNGCIGGTSKGLSESLNGDIVRASSARDTRFPPCGKRSNAMGVLSQEYTSPEYATISFLHRGGGSASGRSTSENTLAEKDSWD